MKLLEPVKETNTTFNKCKNASPSLHNFSVVSVNGMLSNQKFIIIFVVTTVVGIAVVLYLKFENKKKKVHLQLFAQMGTE